MTTGLFGKLKYYYYRFLKSPEDYARFLGVKIGKGCLIGTRNWPSEPYLVTIGDNVQVTSGVSLFTHGGAGPLRANHPKFDFFGRIVIQDWAYIGANSLLMPGVTIGEGALVAAGSVVTKSVEPRTVVGGNPAKFICTIDEFYERNKQYDLGIKGMKSEDKKTFLLSLNEDRFVKK